MISSSIRIVPDLKVLTASDLSAPAAPTSGSIASAFGLGRAAEVGCCGATPPQFANGRIPVDVIQVATTNGGRAGCRDRGGCERLLTRGHRHEARSERKGEVRRGEPQRVQRGRELPRIPGRARPQARTASRRRSSTSPRTSRSNAAWGCSTGTSRSWTIPTTST